MKTILNIFTIILYFILSIELGVVIGLLITNIIKTYKYIICIKYILLFAMSLTYWYILFEVNRTSTIAHRSAVILLGYLICNSILYLIKKKEDEN